jgi:nucleoside-diphosphate-sugar epimerase
MASTNVIKRKLLVLGGNGYVGQAICRAALQSSAFDVVRSLSRSGAPSTAMGGLSRVEWVKGDVFDTPALSDVMFNDIDIVISVIGAFGSNEYMQRICGDATINAVQVAKDMMGVRKVSTFGFISSAQVYDGSVALCLPPSAPMYGYFQGKRRAEEELLKCFPNNHVILRPGFVYGARDVGGRTIPLQYVGGPIDYVGRKLGPISSVLQMVPFVGKELSSMVPVESVANAMIGSVRKVANGGNDGRGIIMDAEMIRNC